MRNQFEYVKLGLVLCLAIMLVIPINYVVAQNPCYGCNSPTLNSTDFQEARQKIIQEDQIKSLEEQHAQDLHIMNLLITISVGLGSGIIVFAVIFVKNRKSQNLSS